MKENKEMDKKNNNNCLFSINFGNVCGEVYIILTLLLFYMFVYSPY